MVDSPYSGTATRTARYNTRPPVQGVNADHFNPDPEPDPFNPVPDTPPNQGGSVLNQDAPFHSAGTPNLADVPIHHWYDGQAAVPSNVETASRMQAMQERMMVDHADTNYVPDGIRLYQHASEGQANEFQVGRMPVAAGATIPDGPLAGLGNGKNSYDQTNGTTEVYGAGESNVGRYRLGVKTNITGLYESPLGKFGQDALIHSYTGLSPALPQDKPPMQNTAPYTPNSTGTAHWFPTQSNQIPSLFSIPSETALTDFATVSDGNSEFVDRGGDFI